MNFLLRSGSSARALNIGELFFFSDFYLLSVFLNASIRIISKSRKDFIIVQDFLLDTCRYS